jgi:hypothetical protein
MEENLISRPASFSRPTERGCSPIRTAPAAINPFPAMSMKSQSLREHSLRFVAGSGGIYTDYAPFIHDLRFTNGHAFRHIADGACREPDPGRHTQPAPLAGDDRGLDQ